jgi:hypothetical protein
VLDELTAPRQDRRIHILAPYIISYYDMHFERPEPICVSRKCVAIFGTAYPGAIHESAC